MARSFLAIFGGLVCMVLTVMLGTLAAAALFIPGGMGAMSGATPHALPQGYLAANLVVSLLAAVAGGWLTARLSPHSPRAHTFTLAALVAAMSIFTVMAEGRQPGQPGWYAGVVAVLGIGGVILGGVLGKRGERVGRAA
jgi:hypothetical protein